jgi:hypothetical protein
VAVALIAGGGLLGALSLPRVERELGDAAVETRVPTMDGLAVLHNMPTGTAELIATIRRDLPRKEPVRVVNAGGTCTRVPIGQGQGLVYWLQYALLPRPLTCDPAARWTVYIDVHPPAGARAVLSVPRLSLVRR